MNISTLILGLVFIVIGFIGGAMVALLWTEREKRTEVENDKRDSQRPKDPIFLRLQNEQLEVWMEGKPRPELQQLNPAQRETAMKLFAQYRKWLGIEERSAPGITEVKIPLQAGLDHPPATSVTVIAPRTITSDRNLKVTSIQADGPPAAKKSPASMVEEINAIVQDHLEENALEERGIRLEEDSQHGVVVWIGLQKYYGINELPDPQVQSLIKSAVAEWEQRSGGTRGHA